MYHRSGAGGKIQTPMDNNLSNSFEKCLTGKLNKNVSHYAVFNKVRKRQHIHNEVFNKLPRPYIQLSID